MLVAVLVKFTDSVSGVSAPKLDDAGCVSFVVNEKNIWLFDAKAGTFDGILSKPVGGKLRSLPPVVGIDLAQMNVMGHLQCLQAHWEATKQIGGLRLAVNITSGSEASFQRFWRLRAIARKSGAGLAGFQLVTGLESSISGWQLMTSRETSPLCSNRRGNGHAHSNDRAPNGEAINELTEQITSLAQQVAAMQLRMERMESLVVELCDLVNARKTVKESYTTKEVADILGKKAYPVREWCRLQRVHAFKAMCGRDCEEEWRITHEELLRIQNEGLLPEPGHY